MATEYHNLLFTAEHLDDVEHGRIAAENRLRSIAREELAAIDGDVSVLTGLSGIKLVDAVSSVLPQLQPYAAQAAAMIQIEAQAIKALERDMRHHPLCEWVQGTVGVGLKQAGRLLAAIGDLTYNHASDRPRGGPRELWAYCGYTPGMRNRRGVRSNWNVKAKMRARLIAESCIKKQHSPYRPVYDAARARYAAATHLEACARCGKDKVPAPVGSPLSAGHQHACALRVVAKALLKDMFLEQWRLEGHSK